MIISIDLFHHNIVNFLYTYNILHNILFNIKPYIKLNIKNELHYKKWNRKIIYNTIRYNYY